MRNFKRVFALGVLTLCLASAQMAHAAPSEAEKTKAAEKIKRDMVENYLLWQIAVELGDADRIISFEAPEFTHVLQNGEVLSKAVADRELRALTKRIRKVHRAKVYVKRINIEPHRVVVWAERELEADIPGVSNAPAAPTQRLSYSGTTHDTWVRYSDHWVLKRIKSVTSNTRINGKPIAD